MDHLRISVADKCTKKQACKDDGGSISSLVGSVTYPKTADQSEGSVGSLPGADMLRPGSRNQEELPEEEEEEEDIDKYFQPYLERMQSVSSDKAPVTKGTANDFRNARRHSLALALNGIKKRFNSTNSVHVGSHQRSHQRQSLGQSSTPTSPLSD